MHTSRSFLFSILVAVLLLPGVSFAGEIRVLDSMGLTRAVKSVEGAAKVVVSAHIDKKSLLAVDVVLSHVDGLAADVEGFPSPDHTIVFSDVPEGVWKIKSSEPELVISEVKIVQ
jgi:hypothetical protein